MKFLRARFKNFRLLRDVDFDFSVDKEKNLTVIRAANETGKTTAKTALIWALYGSESLPRQGKDFPLHPADIDKATDQKINISVEIDYTVEEVSTFKGQTLVRQKNYRLSRSCVETVGVKGFVRSAEVVTLHELTSQGASSVSMSDIRTRIEQALPSSLKDVFFTDGDAALAFIAADSSTSERRKRVRAAVESLLGLNDLEALIKRTGEIRKEIQASMDSTDYTEVVSKLEDRKQYYIDEIADQSQELDETKDRLKDLEKKERDVAVEIEKALKRGDKTKLVNEIAGIKRNINKQEGVVDSSLKAIRKILRDKDLAFGLIKNKTGVALDLLDKMAKDRKLPKQSIPVLSELLSKKECFCGSPLEGPGSEERVQHIKDVIKDSEASDRVQAFATDLYYGMKGFSSSEGWLDSYNKQAGAYFVSANVLESLKLELEGKEKEVDLIDDEGLDMLRKQYRVIKKEIDDLRTKRDRCEFRIAEAKEKGAEIDISLASAIGKLNKDDSSVRRYKLASQVSDIFSGTLSVIRERELNKVSREMNRIFLEMIGADSEASVNGIIKSAELTEDFDIQVLGPNEHQLDPDRDLNGASRRAITLAFILALTKVSKVEAPNVIDTPLGMMSGFVKRSVLLRTIEESAQPILFLTHDEIKGVEDILDRNAGIVFTMTNPGHYPVQLVNQPDVVDARVIKCECSHREYCSVCERKVFGMEESHVV